MARILSIISLGFNTQPLGAVKTGGVGDLFPRIRKDFKVKSSIPRSSAAGYYLFPYIVFFVNMFCKTAPVRDVYISVIDQ
jgi:hypothetical protein